MTSLTIENYVKTIYQLCSAHGNAPAATGQLAAAMGVSPGTVTSMLKTLKEGGLAAYTPYEGVRLTDAGRALALRVLRRHRLIELFLSQTLRLPWDEVHAEAENMEHAVSDHLIDRIDEYLGFPTADPHGDPIPQADGTVQQPVASALNQWEIGRPFQFVRVLDQSSEFLRHLSDVGLALGTHGAVRSKRPETGVLVLDLNNSETAVSLVVAEKILVADPQ